MKINNKTIGYISIVTLLAMTSLLSINLYSQQRTSHDEIDIGIFPYTVDDWEGKDLRVTEKEYRILETRNLILREYVNSADDKLMLFIVYSETNRSVFHPPEVCFVGSGIEIVDKKVEKIDYGKRSLSANKIYTKKGNYKGMALYAYKAGNLYTDKYYFQQAYFAFNQLFQKRVRGATIRISMPLKENEETTVALLRTFMEESARIIDSL